MVVLPSVKGVKLESAAGIALTGEMPISAFFTSTIPSAISNSPTRYCGKRRFKFMCPCPPVLFLRFVTRFYLFTESIPDFRGKINKKNRQT
ncbi:MAG: hypothetical protein LUG25_01755 [Oscillospiraceae bacterium]|nr:hypothetical protein [Oscillospiraceae bacterium]